MIVGKGVVDVKLLCGTGSSARGATDGIIRLLLRTDPLPDADHAAGGKRD